MRLRVTQFGESILKEKGRRVEAFDRDLRELAQNMLETMYAEEGIGLAAQQVGQSLQLFVMDLQRKQEEVDFEYSVDGRSPPLDLIMPMVMVNPEVQTSGRETLFEEGCLSFPGIRGKVTRPEAVTVHFQDLEGKPHTATGNGIFARCILHEYDHIQGKLFIERMSPQTLSLLQARLKKLRRETRDFLKSHPHAKIP